MSLAIAVTTIDRPRTIQRFVNAVRLRLPEIPIYVADQSRDTPEMAAFYAAQNVTLIPMDYDTGLSASRNRLMAEIVEDYVWLFDDDYLFYDGTSFVEALAILDARPDIAVVGGRVFDLAGDRLRLGRFENFLHHDRRNQMLVVLPIDHIAPILRRAGGVSFYLCDTVHNFAIFRRSIFDDTIKWDDVIKINGEHEDFYLTLKQNSNYRVAYLPQMVAFHRPDETNTVDYHRLRSRNEFWRHFKQKWDVSQYVEIGTGTEFIGDSDASVPPEEIARRFFQDIAAPPHRRRPLGRLANHPIARSAPSERRPGARPKPAPPPTVGTCAGGTPPALPHPFAPEEWRFVCQYDPVHSGGSDFTLWLRAEKLRAAADADRPLLALQARWFSADDRVLVWEAGRTTILLSDAGEWLPIALDVPLIPRGSAFVRFEIMAASGQRLVPLCCGFLLPGTGEDRNLLAGREVLALAISTDAAAAFRMQAETSEAAIEAPVILPARRIGPPEAGLLLLDLDPAFEFETLYFEHWPGAGNNLLSVRVPDAGVDVPRALALPDIASSGRHARIFARDRTGTLHRVAAGKTLAEIACVTARATTLPRHPRIAVVVTSCGRQDLLERTLDSFFAFNTAPLAQFIVVEDGAAETNAPLKEKYRERNITWLATAARVGQIAAIDYAYSYVDAPYIFHLEDDWEFYRSGFIENSLTLLHSLPDCLQVWIRALDDTNGHPLSDAPETVEGLRYRRLQFGFRGNWNGFSFNPGLRRSTDYLLLGKYQWFAASEACLSQIYRQLGFYAVVLADADGKGYVHHIGWDRHVDEPAAVGGLLAGHR